jgi:hypothetical protein
MFFSTTLGFVTDAFNMVGNVVRGVANVDVWGRLVCY